MLWVILSLLTAGRLLVAATGSFSGLEAYLMLCAQRLDWGFVEGPAGIPALIRVSAALGGWSPFGVRLLSPLLLLLASVVLGRLACRLRGKEVAFWSVVAFNLLPLANVAGLVMDGTMVAAALWMMALSWSWLLVVNKKNSLPSWIGFGFLLGITTQVSYAVGWLLPLLLIIMVKRKQVNVLGIGSAFLLLLLSWIGPLWWNAHHDWLQWSHITWGSFWSWKIDFVQNFTPAARLEGSLMPFLILIRESLWCWTMLLSLPLFFLGITNLMFSSEKKQREDNFYFLVLLVVPFLFFLGSIGHDDPSFALQLVLSAMLLPGIVSFFLKTAWAKKMGLALLMIVTIFSLLIISEIIPPAENSSSWFIPSSRGVVGVQKIAVELLRLRALEIEASAQPPFIIAETPDLAALLGAVLPIHYPELLGAPSVFTPESPSFSSQFQLWPHYADAVATGIVDPLYTEETKTSPFLGRNAFYVTTESSEELPETISGAFATVVPIGEGTLQRGKRPEHLIIYTCKNYQMLSL